MSEDDTKQIENMEEINETSPTPAPAPFETNLDVLSENLYIHKLLKESEISKHYIAEEVIQDSQSKQYDLLYIKQMHYKTKEEHVNAVEYYNNLLNYYQLPFAKSDLVKMAGMFHYENDNKNIFEIDCLFEYGGSDMIDLDSIKENQVLKFVKNILLIVMELKKYQNLYHGNISLKNIVYCNGDLKLSGFKPIYTKSPSFYNWKNQVVELFSTERLDIFCIGLIWLQFLKVDVQDVANRNYDIGRVREAIGKTLEGLRTVPLFDLLQKMVSLDEFAIITMEEVSLEFDEHFLLLNYNTRTSIDNTKFACNDFFQKKSSQGQISFQEQDSQIRCDPLLTNSTDLFKKQLRESDFASQNNNANQSKVGTSNRLFTLRDNFTYQQNQSTLQETDFSFVRQKIDEYNKDIGDLHTSHKYTSVQLRNNSEEEGDSQGKHSTHCFMTIKEGLQGSEKRDKITRDKNDLVLNDTINEKQTYDNEDYNDLEIKEIDKEMGENTLLQQKGEQIRPLINLQTEIKGGQEQSEGKLILDQKLQNDTQEIAISTPPQEQTISQLQCSNYMEMKKQSLLDQMKLSSAPDQNITQTESIKLFKTNISSKNQSGVESIKQSNTLLGQSENLSGLQYSYNQGSSILRELKEYNVTENNSKNFENSPSNINSPKMSSQFVNQQKKSPSFQPQTSQADKDAQKSKINKSTNPPITKTKHQTGKATTPNKNNKIQNIDNDKQPKVRNKSTQKQAVQKNVHEEKPKSKEPLRKKSQNQKEEKKDTINKKNVSQDKIKQNKNKPIYKNDIDKGIKDKQVKQQDERKKTQQTKNNIPSNGQNSNKVLLQKNKNTNKNMTTGKEEDNNILLKVTEEQHNKPISINTSQTSLNSISNDILSDNKLNDKTINTENKNVQNNVDVLSFKKNTTLEQIPTPNDNNIQKAFTAPTLIDKIYISNGNNNQNTQEDNNKRNGQLNQEDKNTQQELQIVQDDNDKENNQDQQIQKKPYIATEEVKQSQKRIYEKYQKMSQKTEEKRTLSNLEPEKIERAKKERRIKQEKLEMQKKNDPDRIKQWAKEQIQLATGKTLTEEQKQQINQTVLNIFEVEHQKKKIEEEQRKTLLQQKNEKKMKETELLAQRIRELAKKKKQQPPPSEYLQSQNFQQQTKSEKIPKTPEKSEKEGLTQRSILQKTNNKTISQKQDNTIKQIKLDILNNTFTNQSQIFITTPIQRSKMFYFNHEHEVYNIKFKKFVEGFRKEVMEEQQYSQYKGKCVKRQKNALKKITLLDQKLNDIDILNDLQFAEKGPSSREAGGSVATGSSQAGNASILHLDKIPLSLNELSFIDLLLELKLHSIFNSNNFQILLQPKFKQESFQHIHSLLTASTYEEALPLVRQSINEAKGVTKLELMKLLTRIYYHIGSKDDSYECLQNALGYVNDNQGEGLKNRGEHFCWLLLNSAFLEYERGNYQGVKNMLTSFLIRGEEYYFIPYYNLLGNSHLSMGDYAQAFECFCLYIKYQSKQPLTEQVVKIVSNAINKALHCLQEMGAKIECIQFYKQIDQYFCTEPKIHPPNFLTLLFKVFTFRLLKFSNINHLNGLANFVIEVTIQRKNFDIFLSDQRESLSFISHILSVLQHLKRKRNYGGFANNYKAFLKLAKQLIDNCDISDPNIKISLMIQFDKGLFLLRCSEQQKAFKCFGKCFKIMFEYFGEAKREAFKLIVGVQQQIPKGDFFEFHILFNEQLLQLNYRPSKYYLKLASQLSKQYFWTSQLEKSVQVLQPTFQYNGKIYYFELGMLKFYKRICVLFSSLYYFSNQLFEDFYKALSVKFVQCHENLFMSYMALFDKIIIFKQELNEHYGGYYKLLRQAENIKLQNDINQVQIDQITQLIIDFYFFHISPPNQDGQPTLQLLLSSIIQSSLSPEENALIAIDYMKNLLFLFLSQAPVNGQSIRIQGRKDIYYRLHSLLKHELLKENIILILQKTRAREESYATEKVRTVNDALAQQAFKNSSASLPPPVSPSKTQSDLLQKIDFKNISCNCECDEPIFLTRQYIVQFIKNMSHILRNQTKEEVKSFYDKFLLVIQEKGLSLDQHPYINSLMNFYIKGNENQDFPKRTFLELLDILFKNNNCIHKAKDIFLIIDALPVYDYTKLLFLYLHKFQQALCFKLLTEIILPKFEKCYNKLFSELYDLIFKNSFQAISNFSLIHYINIENTLDENYVPSHSTTTYQIMNIFGDSDLEDLLTSLIGPLQYKAANAKSLNIQTLRSLLTDTQQSHTHILQHYYTQIVSFNFGSLLPQEYFSIFTIDFYVLMNFANVKKFPETQPLLFDISLYLYRIIPYEYCYYTAFFITLAAKLFFKLKLFDYSIKLQNRSIELLRNAQKRESKIELPVQLPQPGHLVFNVLNTLLIAYVQGGFSEDAKCCLDKLLQRNFGDVALEMEKKAILCFLSIEEQKFDRSYKLLSDLKKMQQGLQNDFQKTIFNIVISKIEFLLASNEDNDQNAELSITSYKNSINQLNELL